MTCTATTAARRPAPRFVGEAFEVETVAALRAAGVDAALVPGTGPRRGPGRPDVRASLPAGPWPELVVECKRRRVATVSGRLSLQATLDQLDAATGAPDALRVAAVSLADLRPIAVLDAADAASLGLAPDPAAPAVSWPVAAVAVGCDAPGVRVRVARGVFAVVVPLDRLAAALASLVH